MYVTKGLVIAEPWIDFILRAEKSWEMRSVGTSFRGWFGLIRKGSGTVVGIAELTDVGVPLTPADMLANIDRHRIPAGLISSGEVTKWIIPWRLGEVRSLRSPVPYRHKSGAVTWDAPSALPASEATDGRWVGRSVLTEGNLKNSHFYMRSFLDAFPADAIGGSNARSRAPRDVVVDWGGESPARTDIDGAKQAMQFAA